jgi:hypothetical protein
MVMPVAGVILNVTFEPRRVSVKPVKLFDEELDEMATGLILPNMTILLPLPNVVAEDIKINFLLKSLIVATFFKESEGRFATA